MRLLNLGCGSRYHASWTNIDISPVSPTIQRCDLKLGIPYGDGHFDAVYHSHVLEHLDRAAGAKLMVECFRVLKPGGIIRVVVPDLEAMVREYIAALEMIDKGDSRGPGRYDWVMLELYDQVVRQKSGGEMLDYLRQSTVPEADYIKARAGTWATEILNGREHGEAGVSSSMRGALRSISSSLRALLNGKVEFYKQGELHRWMYDRYSLSRLLLDTSFREIAIVNHAESRIEGWESYCLDTETNGMASKPDSIYLEAVR